jgi:hypothetical protein
VEKENNMGMDSKRMFGIERISPRELPPPINTPREPFKGVIKEQNLSMDALYGAVKKLGRQATKPWASNRPLAKGAKLPAIGRKKGK